MRLSHLSLRALTARPLRTLLTLLSIVVGVASVVAVLMATSATRRAYADLYQSLAGRAVLQVVSNGGEGFDEKLATAVAEVPNVTTASPVLQRPTILYHGGRRAQVLAMGIDPALDRAIHEYTISAGEMFGDRGGLVLEETFAEQLEVNPGETVKLLTRRGLIEQPVVGILKLAQAAASNQGLVYLRLRDAQRLFRAPGKIDVIYIATEPWAEVGTPFEALRHEIEKRIPTGLRVEPPPAHSALGDESLLALRQGLNLASSLSVVVAAFIIMNAFLMTVSERRKQLAILRAVGATRRQIVVLLLREALILGAIGTAIGMVLGIGGARWIAQAVEGWFDAALPAVEFTPWIAAAGAAVGLGVTFLASYWPAREAGLVSPLEGMRAAVVVDSRHAPWRLPALGVLLGVVGAALVIAAIDKRLPLWASTPGTLALLVAMVCILPLGLRAAVAIVGWVLGWVLGFEGRLAQQQLLRRRSRSVLTVGALFIASATGIGMGLTVLNDAEDVDNWADRAIGGDFFVRAMMPHMGTGEAADLPEGLGDEIKKIPGVAAVRAARAASLKSGEQTVVVIAREFRPADKLYLDLKQGEPDEVRQALQEGSVVIGTVLSSRANLHVGDTIPLETPQGTKSLPIVGVAGDYSAGGLVVFMKRELAEKLLSISGVDLYVVQAAPGQLNDVERQLKALCQQEGLLLQSYAEIRGLVAGIKNGIVGALWGLLALGFVVAAFGIANSLTMNVLEQGREIGMLRIVGTTRRQLRRMILAQALIMALVGLTPGLLAGILIAWISNLTSRATVGHASEFQLRPTMLMGVLAIGLVIVLIAGLTPAIRAARLNPLAALHEE